MLDSRRSLLLLVALVTSLDPYARRLTSRATFYERLEGVVIDAQTRAPVPNVVLTVLDSSAHVVDSTTTIAAGRFRLDHVIAGRTALRARRVGYLPFSLDTALRANETLRLTIALEALPTALENVTVRENATALLYAQLEEHRKSGFGRFLTDAPAHSRARADCGRDPHHGYRPSGSAP